MFEKIKTFWSRFWFALSNAYNKAFRDPPKERVQLYRDTTRINFAAIFVSKLNNLANTETTFSIYSDSAQAEPLIDLVADLEDKRFEVTADMLGDGDAWVFPATDGEGGIYHRYATQDRVRILGMDGNRITDIIGIVDEYANSDGKVFFLCRRHTLSGGTLTIDTYTTNEQGQRVMFDEWAEFESVYRITGATSIGVGRFKSPISSRGKSPVYGVPINFGCEEIEAKIISDMEMIETEFSRAESKIFADPLVLKKSRGKDGNEIYSMPEGFYAVAKRAGDAGASIDIFSPEIRYDSYRSKLIDDMAQYEQQVGTDKGFLTQLESVSATTATEIRRANASTISLIDRIHTAITVGVESTIEADAMFLGIAEDLYTIGFDFFDPFADADAQGNRLREAVNDGYAEPQDYMKWLFPNMNSAEIEEKLDRIIESKQRNIAVPNINELEVE